MRKDAVHKIHKVREMLEGRNRYLPSLASGRVFGFLCLSAVAILALSGCGGLGPRSGEMVDEGSRETSQPAVSQAEVPTASKRFEEPGELDRLLDAKPIALAAVKPASASHSTGSASKSPEPVSKGKGNFRIQVGAESDVDAAQSKKLEYERSLGGSVDVVFDAPYYKLRWGWFDTKQDAEDKILEMSDLRIQMLVVKQ